MSRRLDDLSYRIKPTVFEFLARCTEAGIALMIVGTGRTVEEQEEYVRIGTSWTMFSKHLPQPPDMKSLAIDVCPFEIYNLHGADKLKWDATDPVWKRIGTIAESVGLKWGVIINGVRKDLGHLEYKAVRPSGIKQDDFIV